MQAKKKTLTILVVFFLLPNLVWRHVRAELSPPPPLTGIGWRQSVPYSLLRDEAVRKDLGITAELVQNRKDRMPQFYWNEVLTPEQKDRLNQIHLQQERLTNVFSDAAVIRELGGFTAEQKQKIYEVHRWFDVRLQSIPGKIGNKGPLTDAEFQKEYDATMKLYEEGLSKKCLNVLTPEQLKKFEALKGKPLEIPNTDRRAGN